MIAAGKLETSKHPYGYDTASKKWKGAFRMIFNSANFNDFINKKYSTQVFYTSEAKSFAPNSSGCYNMIGNVAEMVSEKGIAKGGSYMHLLDSCKIQLRLNYTKPAKWLGFRCVAVRVK